MSMMIDEFVSTQRATFQMIFDGVLCVFVEIFLVFSDLFQVSCIHCKFILCFELPIVVN